MIDIRKHSHTSECIDSRRVERDTTNVRREIEDVKSSVDDITRAKVNGQPIGSGPCL